MAIGAALALAGIGGITQFSFERGAAKLQIEAAKAERRAAFRATEANLLLAFSELTRQQQDVRDTAEEQISDRMRQASKELGAIRVAMSAGGGSNFARAAQEAAAVSGTDIARIQRMRDSGIAALQAAKTQARQDAMNMNTAVSIQTGFQIAGARHQQDTAFMRSFMGAAGIGVQIAAQQHTQKSAEKAATNPVR